VSRDATLNREASHSLIFRLVRKMALLTSITQIRYRTDSRNVPKFILKPTKKPIYCVISRLRGMPRKYIVSSLANRLT